MRIALALLMAVAFISGCAASNEANSLSPPFSEPKYASNHPLYINVVFGEKPSKGMLIVLDESKGDGAGYDVAYVDDNMDGDLTHHKPISFPVRPLPDGAKPYPTVAFTAPRPYKDTTLSQYSLDLYSLAGSNSKTPVTKDLYFFWRMTDADKWNYFFINGKFHVYPTATDAMRGEPIKIAGKCDWSVTAKQDGENAVVSVGLKDANGCTLRTASSPAGDVAPTLTLLDKAGKEIVKDKKLEFG
ncbi:MAG: hypothetical protein NTU53_17700 [Planctomycetota bacterium]|nr:hypothetical protein [Planctomycetota bacterium]